MHVDANAGGAQGVENLAPAEPDLVSPQPNDVEVPRGIGVGVLPWTRQRQLCKQRVVTRRELTSSSHKGVEARHLAGPKRRLNVGHAVIEPEVDLLVEPRTVTFLIRPLLIGFIIIVRPLRVADNSMRS